MVSAQEKTINAEHVWMRRKTGVTFPLGGSIEAALQDGQGHQYSIRIGPSRALPTLWFAAMAHNFFLHEEKRAMKAREWIKHVEWEIKLDLLSGDSINDSPRADLFNAILSRLGHTVLHIGLHPKAKGGIHWMLALPDNLAGFFNEQLHGRNSFDPLPSAIPAAISDGKIFWRVFRTPEDATVELPFQERSIWKRADKTGADTQEQQAAGSIASRRRRD